MMDLNMRHLMPNAAGDAGEPTMIKQKEDRSNEQ